ncbi:axin-1-like [Gigantopelta aegis]|uniref:axin-1-like n=1 Tax=Gigantopelta aegis TaxID=1735272 RepID=UPI001B88D49C|nr:axin-1-like [Gigantopelta aegis]XP_041362837.1 axin-1-like [Gigantopelta aegis]XP_041362838.1 axin-1-like [Gigantopelta aegis]
MTSKVYEFLNDSGGNNFTETSQRPPVPGEENELQSNGGMSTQSSGSHKSHVSTKSTRSQSSNKSAKSTKSAASKKGELTHSPAATPRKSNLDKTNGSLKCSSLKLDNDDMDAPLGFEPEGSAASSPPFTENSTPPHLKWAENISHLLNDSEGVDLFKEYLKKEHGGYTEVLFWFACQGLKQTCNPDDVPGIIKAIFKGFIRSDKIPCLNASTKRKIVDSFSRKEGIDRSIFDSAQAEVEKFMRSVTYPAFLNSDFYVQYVQTYSDSPKSSHSSGSNSARPVSQSGPLPSLPEDKELDTSIPKTLMGPPLVNKVPGHKFSRYRGTRRPETYTGNMYYTPKKDPSYPTHISYAPASAQDSELQSLSSDALTDDTMSVADSSIDIPHYNWKRHKKNIKSLAQQNRETYSSLHSQFIPRTERAPKDRNIAETDPKRFACLLIEKLEKVKEKLEAEAKMEEKLRSLNESECTEENVSMTTSFSHKNTTATSIMPIMSTSAIEEETAESILDQHCSRIWANSNHHTPSRSPGRHSPQSKSPDRLCRKLQSQTLPVVASAGGHSRRKRVTKDFVSSLSCDSGVGEDKCEMETHRHIHHHHHHHHPSGIRTQQQIEIEAQNLTMGYWVGDKPPGSASRSFSEAYTAGDRGRTSKKASARKGSDTSSYVDSGISSVALDKDSIPRMPNWNDPASEKVMQWMMDSERVQEVSATYGESSEKSSTHKRSHRERLSVSVGPTMQPHKQSSKKTGAFSASRPTSVERASIMPFQPMGASQIQPNQPFAQDPSMPLPPPPNPITQIEEARRRVANMADESRSASITPGPVKSKSFTGVPSREKNKATTTTLSSSQMRTMPSARTIPSDLDMSAGSQTFDRSKVAKKPSTGVASNNTSMNTTGSSSITDGNQTIVGIYFGQEPIPYRHVITGRTVTLGMFKTLITKKGSFKYFFKRDSDEFGEGAVFEEITDDSAVLPMWQDKVVAKVEKMD